MRLAIGAGFLAVLSLLAFGPANAAFATGESPTPSPVVTDETSESVTGTEMSCKITDTDSDEVTIRFEPPEPLDELTVTVDDENVKFEEVDENSIVVSRPESNASALLEGSDADNQQQADCTVELPGAAETPPPTESEKPDETEPTPEPTPTEQSATQIPEPTDTPTPTPAQTPSTQVSPPPSEAVTPPTSASPTPPTSPTATPATPRPPSTNAPPPTPYSPPVSPTPPPSSPTAAPPVEEHNAADSDRRATRDIRPLAESPRYLLPQLFGVQPHRGSPLVMPGPRDADERAAELETLPPISEDELEAIKAQLSSPGHADQAPTGTHVESAPQEQPQGQGSWWLLGGLMSAGVIGAVLWWVLGQRRRSH